jgi:hypothetical protein
MRKINLKAELIRDNFQNFKSYMLSKANYNRPNQRTAANWLLQYVTCY